jgi:hypothetical protein
MRRKDSISLFQVPQHGQRQPLCAAPITRGKPRQRAGRIGQHIGHHAAFPKDRVQQRHRSPPCRQTIRRHDAPLHLAP